MIWVRCPRWSVCGTRRSTCTPSMPTPRSRLTASTVGSTLRPSTSAIAMLASYEHANRGRDLDPQPPRDRAPRPSVRPGADPSARGGVHGLRRLRRRHPGGGARAGRPARGGARQAEGARGRVAQPQRRSGTGGRRGGRVAVRRRPLAPRPPGADRPPLRERHRGSRAVELRSGRGGRLHGGLRARLERRAVPEGGARDRAA